MAKSKSNSQSNARPFILLALILAIVLPIIVGLFLKDSRGVAYGWFIGGLWAVATLVAFTLGVLYLAQYVLPPYKGDSWWEGVVMIWRHATQSLSMPQALSARRRTLQTSPPPGTDELPHSFDNARAGVLRSHQALAIGRGSGFSRAAGPGYVRLRSGEKIVQVVDLRKHMRTKKMTAMTRDGIRVTVSATVIFKIRDEDHRPIDDPRPYTYDPDAIFLASQAGTVNDNDEIVNWSEQLAQQAASYLANAVAQHTLNDLLDNHGVSGANKKRIEQELKQQFEPQGIEIISVGGKIIEMPPDVGEMRLVNWSAPWERQIQEKYAYAKSEEIRHMKRARARAQIEIIQNIIENIEEMRRRGQDNLTEVVTLRMIEALEDAMGNSTLKTIVPEQILARLVMDTSGQMRNLLPPIVEGDENT